jgi:hypothetical protein
MDVASKCNGLVVYFSSVILSTNCEYKNRPVQGKSAHLCFGRCIDFLAYYFQKSAISFVPDVFYLECVS